jgi:L-ascorbate metabolism protein UlaG (beta-lactamase superfamily)
MKLTWYGHAAFLLETEQGTRLIIDPYLSGSYDGQMAYDPIEETAHAVLISHEHPDHNAPETIPGHPEVLFQAEDAEVREVRITGVRTFHDEREGADRGDSMAAVIEADGLRLVHLGDLGHRPDEKTLQALAPVDVLLVPVGGFFTIDAATAGRVVDQLAPRVVVPMHYRTDRCHFDIAGVEDFLQGKENVERPGRSTLDLRPETLPAETTVIVLEHAR